MSVPVAAVAATVCPGGRTPVMTTPLRGRVAMRRSEMRRSWPGTSYSSRARRLQETEGHALAGAAVPGARVAAALRDQLISFGRAFEEALRAEGGRVAPEVFVVVLAVDIQEHRPALRERVTPPGEVPDRPAAEEGGERVQPADLVGERDGLGAVRVRQPCPVLGPSVQGVRGEGDEPAHGDRGAEHVEQFHRRCAHGQRSARTGSGSAPSRRTLRAS